MDSNKRYMISEHIRYEISAGTQERVLIIPNMEGVPDMRNVLCLSDTSLYIWKMIVEQKNFGQMVDEMCQKYKRGKEELERDLKEFIETLLEKRYISVME